MKNKLFFIEICFTSVVLCLTIRQENKVYSYENSIEKIIATSLDLDYDCCKDGYSVKNGDIVSQAIYDEKGNLINISATSYKTEKLKMGKDESLPSSNANMVDTKFAYDDDNRLIDISTSNQKISFTREKNMIKKAEINGDIIFENKTIGNKKVVQQFANKTQIIKTQLEEDKYTIKYGNLEEFSIVTRDNQYPISIKESGSDSITYYDYDCNGILNSVENEYGSVIKTDDTLMNNSFGKQLITKFSNDSLFLSFNGVNNYHQITRIDDFNNSSSLAYDDRNIYTFVSSCSFAGYDGYSDIFGNFEDYKFDHLGFLTTIANHGILTKQYTYDDYGKLTSSFDDREVYLYTYDNSGNLKSEKHNNKIVVYQYDNRNNLNQLTSIDNKKIEYDDLGNLVEFKGDIFDWDGGQLLKSSTINEKVSTYEYGADKIRKKRMVDARCIEYQYFNGYLMASRDDNGATLYFYDNENNALGFVFNDKIYLYVKDPLGVIRGVVNEELEPVIIYDYDDWGSPSIKYCSSQDVLMANMMLYKDYVYDNDSNLYYLGSRYYLPEIRRFISQDSLERIGEVGSKDYNYNLYSYCSNNPIMLSDQFGYEAITLTFSTLFFAFACVVGFIVVSVLVTKIIDEIVNTFKFYSKNINNQLIQTKNEFYELVNKFKKEALLAFGEYALTIWMWWMDNGKREHHHIIAKTSAKCTTSRRLFTTTYKYDINDGANMIWLKYRFHKHLHTDAYYSAVDTYTVLGNKLGGKYLFLAHLAEIKGALLLLNESLIF